MVLGSDLAKINNLDMTIKNTWHIYFIGVLSIILLAGCSENTRPEVLEPILTLSEAADISHTSAKVTSTVNRRGSAKMSYLNLFYGETGSTLIHKLAGNPDLDIVEFDITDLKPGRNYTCYIEAGTLTATLKSNAIRFTTTPNELPRLSSPVPLSTGPLGIIVKFSILEDGGESILEAGCNISKAGSSDAWKIYLPKDNLLMGEWQVSISGLKPLTKYTITPFASNSTGMGYGAPLEYTTKSSIVLMQPGDLTDLFKEDTDIDLDVLTISGPMNGSDFRTLRTILGAPQEMGENIYNVKANSIDLTDVVITEGGDSYDRSRFTVADEVTTDIFADCILLRNAILPNSAKILARNAFARCRALESITISAGIEQILPSAECSSLTSIEVSEANANFSSIEGVLFNHDASEILWFPLAKNGDYRLPSTIKTIGENAFAGTSITTLIIPSSVTTISRGAFCGSSLKEIFLPDNLTNISEGMFQNCTSLTIVHLGSGTEFVGDYVFDGSDISDIYIAASIPPFASADAFFNSRKPLAENCILHVPAGSKKIYRNNAKWGIFNNIEEY